MGGNGGAGGAAGFGGAGGEAGSGGIAGAGGEAGSGGVGGVGGGEPCDAVVCQDTECKFGGACNPDDGSCTYGMFAEDGTACSEGECLAGACGPIGAFACTEQGIRDAIAAGGGPHFFACDGPTTVVIEAALVIDNDVILDGEEELTVEGEDTHPMLEVAAERTVELRGFELGNSVEYPSSDIVSLGTLTLTRSRLFASIFENDGTLTIADSSMARRPDWNVGAAISNAGVLFVTNSNFWGVHIANLGGATATVDGSTFSALSTPTALYDLSGIVNHGPLASGWESGTVTLTNSTISGSAIVGIENGGTMSIENSTISGNGLAFGGGFGGGILNFGALTVTNSTISGNTAMFGGGIYNMAGTLTLTNATIWGNTASERCASICILNGATVTVTNSVFEGDCETSTGTLISAGHNIESPGDTCGFDQGTDQVSVSSGAVSLGPLADNGGPTETHALLPGSVAIDAIPELMCEATEDQRGEPRPGGTMCDVGAFELQP
jgi:hypothetical protein